MGLEHALRAELEELDARRSIVEDALARLAGLEGSAVEEPEAPEETKPSKKKELRRTGFRHPTLGWINIDRKNPRWERAWRHDVARLKDAIRAHPRANAMELAVAASVSGGHASTLLRFLEAEGEIEADRPEDRMRAKVPNKTYHVVEDEAEVTSSEPETEPEPERKPKRTRKRRGKRAKPGENAKRIFAYVGDHPDCTTTEIAAALQLDNETVRKHLHRFRKEGRLIQPSLGVGRRGGSWRHAVQDPARPQPEKEPQREVKITPGEGVDLGRLKGTSIGGAS